ncbi:hypothetical protein MKEN_01486300 [Mycena kentingensis (nom. inval.)]|nr:hypothetical protein MKEN_01486300 [Mycena kentingensis (nom. inval.)]
MRCSLLSLLAVVGTHLFVGASPTYVLGRNERSLDIRASPADDGAAMDVSNPEDGIDAIPDDAGGDPTEALSGLTDLLNGLLGQVGGLLNGLLGSLLSGGSAGGGDLLSSLSGLASGLGGAADSFPTSGSDAGVGYLSSQLAGQLGDLGSQMSGQGGVAPPGTSPADIASALQAIIDAASTLFELLAPASGDMADDVSGQWDDANA